MLFESGGKKNAPVSEGGTKALCYFISGVYCTRTGEFSDPLFLFSRKTAPAPSLRLVQIHSFS